MKNSWIIGFTLIISAHTWAQDPIAEKYAKTLNTAALRDHLTIIASDALEGRDTGARGQKMAAALIGSWFEELGLKPIADSGFFQPVKLYSELPAEGWLQIANEKLINLKDVFYYGRTKPGKEISIPVVFGGRGDSTALKGLDLQGKGVVIVLGGNDGFRTPRELARKKGASLLLVCYADTAAFEASAARARRQEAGRLSLGKPDFTRQDIGVFLIRPDAVEKIFGKKLHALFADVGKKKSKKPAATVTYKINGAAQLTRTENVLGFLEGTDKKDEVVVVTAHYDHVGKGGSGVDKIYNGADDDGSGTVAVMEMAKVFAQAKREGHGPRRSILFMAFTGEESGLLGSEFYANNPVVPLEKTMVNLNIDMIGRRDPEHTSTTSGESSGTDEKVIEAGDTVPYVYLIGADRLSKTLHEVSEQTNARYTKLNLDYTYNDESHPDRLYYRSDHWNFAQKNIPVIFYFAGIHEDYHRPSDEIEKIEFELLLKRTRLIFFTAWELANREDRIVPDVKK